MTTTEESVARRLPRRPSTSHIFSEAEHWLLKRIANSPHERVDLNRFKTPAHSAAVRNLLERGMLQTIGVRRALKTKDLRISDLILLGKGRAPAEFYEPTTPRNGEPVFLAIHPNKADMIRAALKRRSN